ncbi:MAG: hypothetical protein BroJett003_22670 [Planctomycetota bacterium]|nr:MAG: hypothetical protein BroJett003_22670 [Planctomycetota bacterium]
MRPLDEHDELRIVREIHGELGDEESLLLNRDLLKDPELRRVHEAYAEISRLAGESLSELLSKPARLTGEAGAGGIDPCSVAELASDRGDVLRRGVRVSWWRRVEQWFVPLSAAAALLMAVTMPAPPGGTSNTVTGGVDGRDGIFRSPSAGMTLNQPVSTAPGHIQRRDTQRDVIGVIGKDGRYYILELNRTRAVEGQGVGRERAGRQDGV